MGRGEALATFGAEAYFGSGPHHGHDARKSLNLERISQRLELMERRGMELTIEVGPPMIISETEMIMTPEGALAYASGQPVEEQADLHDLTLLSLLSWALLERDELPAASTEELVPAIRAMALANDGQGTNDRLTGKRGLRFACWCACEALRMNGALPENFSIESSSEEEALQSLWSACTEAREALVDAGVSAGIKRDAAQAAAYVCTGGVIRTFSGVQDTFESAYEIEWLISHAWRRLQLDALWRGSEEDAAELLRTEAIGFRRRWLEQIPNFEAQPWIAA